MQINKFTKMLALSSSLLVLASCGSSSGSGGPDGGDIFKTGQFNAATTNTCTLTDASGATHTAPATVDGLATLNVTSLPAGLTTLSCPAGGTYTDETDGSTGRATTAVQRAATIYSGSGPLTLIASPLSEIAYGLADATGDVAASIVSKNTGVAEAFGLSAGFERVIPQDLNGGPITGTGDDATIGMILANLSVLDDGNPGAGSSGVTDLTSLQNVANNVVGVTAGSFTNTNIASSTTTVSTGTVTTNDAPEISGSTSVAAGATTQLSADNAVVWESSDTTVATVNATGLVTGVASGTAVITATNTDIGALFSTITITVTGATAPASTPVASISITSANSATQGDTVNLTATVSPTDATTPTLTWSVLSGGANVSISGTTLSANNAGSAVIQAAATDGSGVVATQAFTVNAAMVDITGLQAVSNSSTASIDITLSGALVGTVNTTEFTVATNATNTLTISSVISQSGTNISLELSRPVVDDAGDTTGASEHTGEAITLSFANDAGSNVNDTATATVTNGVAYDEECDQCILDADGCPF
jgi:uncharacterized protein YjdB